MILKDKTNLAVAYAGQVDQSVCDLLSIQEIASGIRCQQRAQYREQGGLSRTGGSLDCYEVPLFHTQVYVSQDMVEAVISIVKAFLYSY